MSRVPAVISSNHPFSKRLQLDLFKIFLDDILEDEEVELSIILQCKNVNLRQLSALLTITDHFYSRMYFDGIHNYARFENEQLQIKEFNVGSLEIVINAIENSDALKVLVLYILIYHLPKSLESISITVSNFAKAFRDYQDGQLIRETRKSLRKNIKQDKQLESLDSRQVTNLAGIMAEFYARESKLLVQAEKCIKQSVKSISVRKKKKQIDKTT